MATGGVQLQVLESDADRAIMLINQQQDEAASSEDLSEVEFDVEPEEALYGDLDDWQTKEEIP